MARKPLASPAKVVVIARCVLCKRTQEIPPNYKGDPMCPHCFMPLVAERAETK